MLQVAGSSDEEPVYDLLLDNIPLTICCLDWQLTLHFQDGSDIKGSIMIGRAFRLETARGAVAVDPMRPESVAPVLGLMREVIARATASKTGTLTLTFWSGERLIVPPDPQYEAWVASSPAFWKIVCMPGGELAIWSHLSQ
jgi:hypothetical protein